jgi:hypothetical protein
VVVNKSGTSSVTLADSLTTSGNFKVSNGSFNQGTSTVTVTGDFFLMNPSTFTKASGYQSLIFNATGTITDNNVFKQDLGRVDVAGSFGSVRSLNTDVKMSILTIDTIFYLNGKNFTYIASNTVGGSGTLRMQGGETLTNLSDFGTVSNDYVGDNSGSLFTVKQLGSTPLYLSISDFNQTISTFQVLSDMSLYSLKIKSGSLQPVNSSMTATNLFQQTGGSFLGGNGDLTLACRA